MPFYTEWSDSLSLGGNLDSYTPSDIAAANLLQLSRGVRVKKMRSYPKIFKFSLINGSIFSLTPKFAENSHLYPKNWENSGINPNFQKFFHFIF